MIDINFKISLDGIIRLPHMLFIFKILKLKLFLHIKKTANAHQNN